jgi:hypothetical protein
MRESSLSTASICLCSCVRVCAWLVWCVCEYVCECVCECVCEIVSPSPPKNAGLPVAFRRKNVAMRVQATGLDECGWVVAVTLWGGVAVNPPHPHAMLHAPVGWSASFTRTTVPRQEELLYSDYLLD